MPALATLAARAVEGMIRRNLRRSFRGVYWIPPDPRPKSPVILVPNHHGWHDGYVMDQVVRAMGLPALLWIEEFAAFPLFGTVGGMPFPVGDAPRRAATIRTTIRHLQSGERSLVLFAEGVLHQPPNLLPFGRALDVVAAKLEQPVILPVAIRYEKSIHERPECFVAFGEPVAPGPHLAPRTRVEVWRTLDRLAAQSLFERDRFETLLRGTLDVNERWDVRRLRR